MAPAKSDPIQIRLATGSELQQALDLLLDNDGGTQLVCSRDPRDYFFVAKSGTAVDGAISVRQFPARLSAISMPVCRSTVTARDLRSRLFRVAFEECQQRSAIVVVTMPGQDWPNAESTMQQLGFHPAAHVAFFYSGLKRVGPRDPQWELQVLDQTDHEKLLQVVSETYIGTLDVRALHAKLDPQQMLQCILSEPGLQASVSGIVHREGSEAGCLFLSTSSDGEDCELVYLGLIPSCRGRGWGKSLVEFSRQCAASLHASQLSLTVDLENEPAVHAYTNAGFYQYDDRQMYAWPL